MRSGYFLSTSPHSPQRPEAGSVGIVIERIRNEGTLEKFQWYCPNCNNLVHEVFWQVRDLVKDMPPVFEAFYNNEKARACGRLQHLASWKVEPDELPRLPYGCFTPTMSPSGGHNCPVPIRRGCGSIPSGTR